MQEQRKVPSSNYCEQHAAHRTWRRSCDGGIRWWRQGKLNRRRRYVTHTQTMQMEIMSPHCRNAHEIHVANKKKPKTLSLNPDTGTLSNVAKTLKGCLSFGGYRCLALLILRRSSIASQSFFIYLTLYNFIHWGVGGRNAHRSVHQAIE